LAQIASHIRFKGFLRPSKTTFGSTDVYTLLSLIEEQTPPSIHENPPSLLKYPPLPLQKTHPPSIKILTSITVYKGTLLQVCAFSILRVHTLAHLHFYSSHVHTFTCSRVYLFTRRLRYGGACFQLTAYIETGHNPFLQPTPTCNLTNQVDSKSTSITVFTIVL
jgi:hypothetical protein